jgi:hypothetical protein
MYYLDYVRYHTAQRDANYKERKEKDFCDLTFRNNNFSLLLGIDRIYS